MRLSGSLLWAPRFWGFAWGLLGVWGLAFRVWCLAFRVEGLGFRAWGLRFGAYGGVILGFGLECQDGFGFLASQGRSLSALGHLGSQTV